MRDKTKINFCLLAAATMVALLHATSAIHGQASTLDKSVPASGSAHGDMAELLLHLNRTETVDDPLTAKQIEIIQHRIQYSQPDHDAALRVASLNKAIDGLRQIIKDHYGHIRRPMWQTDLAELLLFDHLQVIHRDAVAFYEFGVPSTEQRQAVELAVVEAFEQAVDADDRLEWLQRELPHLSDDESQHVNTGLWQMMMGKYLLLRTQVLLAQAAYGVSLLDDGHGYFLNLGLNRWVRDQARTIAGERRRLLELATQRIRPFTADHTDHRGVNRQALSLAGRASVRLNDLKSAATYFEKAAEHDTGDFAGLEAQLGYASMLEKSGSIQPAQQTFGRLANHALVKSTVSIRLLVIDAHHRFLLRRAEALPADERNTAIADAYDVYLDLLNGTELGQRHTDLADYIYRRWASNTPTEAELSTLPPVVAVGVAETARIDAQSLHAQALTAEQSSSGERAKQLRTDAMLKAERAIHILAQLLQREHLPRPLQARALYNLGAATYFRSVEEAQNVTRAAGIWTQLATQMPDQPHAEQAINEAAKLLRRWHQRQTLLTPIKQAYQRAVAVLLSHFPTSDATDSQRCYYATTVLVPAGRLTEAISVLDEVPRQHQDYFQSRKQILYTLVRLHTLAPTAQKQALSNQITDLARQVDIHAHQSAIEATVHDAAKAMNVAGHCVLVLSDLVTGDGKTQRALKLLKRVIDEYGQDRELVRLALTRKIKALVEAKMFDQVIEQAKNMVRSFGAEASHVIEQTLDHLDSQLDQLRTRLASEQVADRQRQIKSQIEKVALTAVTLGQLIFEDGTVQGPGHDRTRTSRLIYAKSLRLAGRADEALDVITLLIESGGDDAEVIHHAGETYFALGAADGLARAVGYYDQIIVGFSSAPYPPIWWNAWMRRLQIMDQLRQDTADIPIRIRRLRHIDPNLGGPRYKRQLLSLASKHAR